MIYEWQSKDMQKRYVLLSDDYEYVPDNIFPSISRYIVNTGDVILSIVGTVGLVAIVIISYTMKTSLANFLIDHLPFFNFGGPLEGLTALNILIYMLDYCMLIPLYVGKTPQLIFNAKKILFIDEFLFSVLSGSLVLFGSSKLYYYMKNKNGKPHFPFEKVVLPIANLIVLSIVFSIIML